MTTVEEKREVSGEPLEEEEEAEDAMEVDGGVQEGAEVKGKVRGPWSQHEDAILSGLVSKFGARNWSLIARGITGRSGKSCRLRWCNQLDPSVKRKPFTGEVFIRISLRGLFHCGFCFWCCYCASMFVVCFFFWVPFWCWCAIDLCVFGSLFHRAV